VIDLLGIQAEFAVVKVYGRDGGIRFTSISDLGSLGIVHENRQSTKDNSLDLKDIIGMNPN